MQAIMKVRFFLPKTRLHTNNCYAGVYGLKFLLESTLWGVGILLDYKSSPITYLKYVLNSCKYLIQNVTIDLAKFCANRLKRLKYLVSSSSLQNEAYQEYVNYV